MKAALNYLPNPPAPPGNIASLPRPPKHHIYLIVLSLNMAITLVHLGGQQMMINTSKCFLYTEEKKHHTSFLTGYFPTCQFGMDYTVYYLGLFLLVNL